MLSDSMALQEQLELLQQQHRRLADGKSDAMQHVIDTYGRIKSAKVCTTLFQLWGNLMSRFL